jgi:capsular exopolysaccharide synthesis family protein
VAPPLEPTNDLDSLDPSATSASLLQTAWRRKSLVLLGLVGGLVLGTLFYAQATPTYQSTAQVLIIKKVGNPSGGTADPRLSYYEDYLATHSVLIRSQLMVRRAVASDKHNLRALKTFQGLGDPTGAIMGSLAVVRDNSQGTATNILNLTCRGPVPKDCEAVLSAVIESYKEFLEEKYKDISQGTLQQYVRTYDEIIKSRKDKEKALEDFRKTAPLLSWKPEDGKAPQEEWLTQIRTRLATLIVRKAELDGHVEAIETALKEKRDPQAMLALLSTVKSDGAGGKNSLDEQMMGLLLQEQTLLADFGPEHPQVVSLRKRIALTRDLFTRGAGGLERGSLFQGREAKTPSDPIQDHLRVVRQELAEIDGSMKVLGQLVDKDEGKFREVAKYRERERDLKKAVEDELQKESANEQQVRDFKLRQDLGGYEASVIAEPQEGGKVAPVMYQVLGAAMVLGLLGGFGLAYLAESTDHSFRTPAEIRRRLALPVLGHVPLLRPEQVTQAGAGGPALDPNLCTFHKPKAAPSEAYRGLRTALYFSTEGETHKVIQMTSPNARDGKSTLTSNLAVSIAQSGKRVVVVDADLRKPRQHKIFGVVTDRGVAAVIAGEIGVLDAVQATAIPGVSLLPCGKRPDNPAELLTSPLFPEMIERLREEYDFVLIDTPPLLVVSDASAVAPRADGVLMVVRLSKNGRPAAERAKELLSSVGAKILGVVVNGVGRGPGSNNYDYNQYYRYYDYQYSYEYEDDNQGGYYADDETEAEPSESDAEAGTEVAKTQKRKKSSGGGGWAGWFGGR